MTDLLDAVGANTRANLDYPIVIEPLSAEDGGGFQARAPDLPDCMSDGETPAQAATNVQDAIAIWIEAAKDLGHAIPKPSRSLFIAG
jgi:predicted RNase H-like HicB family nuclease